MGTTLTGTTPQDTYDSLIKVTDNGPLSGSLKVLTDGLGNDSALALSTGAASITGTLAVTGATTLTSSAVSLRLGNATSNSGANILIAGASTNKNWSIGVQQNVNAALEFTPTTTNGATTLGTTPAMVILDAGNVGIGTSAPDTLVTLGTTARTDNTAGIKIFRGGGTASYATYGFAGNAVINSVGGDLVFQRESTERARFTTAGLCFNGDFLAANALDDYEEGTWTMGITFGGASVGVTTSANTGTYTKIGRQVTVNGYIDLSSKGSSTGAARITGLPFIIAAPASNLGTASLRLENITFTNQFQAYGGTNTTSILLEEVTVLGTVSDITDADFANNSKVLVNLTYFV